MNTRWEVFIGIYCFSLFIIQVYIVPGSMFGCKHAGWFRIIFAVGQGRLEEGLDRVESFEEEE